ncbi:Uncharacterised protein [Actinobaculum suis]|uniref:HTH cro/C1-type domain-containing protein n=1 Tax=Actinobaculum suis TaxID=1657 RepID=A0A7Z8Y9V2_9ACTO|nr:helix-turn-helix transcriptional regulator [Actinobaculum suis]VDG76923.1 Uncharacterised protein [Actinobaculum suis]
MNRYNLEISEAVRGYLALNGLKQRELAERIGMREMTFSRKICGSRSWRVSELYQLAAAGVKVPPLDGDRRRACLAGEGTAQ